MKEKFARLIDRVKENFKKNRIPIIILLVIWILAVVFSLQSYQKTMGKKSSGNEFYDEVVELCDDLVVEEIVPVEPDSDVLAIKFATYARKNNGSFNVKVVGNKSKTVYLDQTVKANSVQDNAFVAFDLGEKLDAKKDPELTVTITSMAEMDNGAGVYYSTLKAFEGSQLKINGKLQEGDLTLRFLKENEDLMKFYHLIIVWVIVSFSFVILVMLLVNPRYEILFTLIVIAFGLTFWLIITPMSVPDETIHYEYSFQLSNYIMGEKNHLIFDEEYQNYGSFAGHQNISAAYERFIKKINRPMNLDEKNVRMKFDIEESYKICFVPQALGITFARIMNWNMLRTFYTGRLFNLIFYTICIYIAIRNTPVHKVLFGILATLPIFMQQAASFSYDCYINGITFVIIAFLMKWMFSDKEISKKEFIFVFIVNLLIAPIKVVYGLFTLLYWFVPVEKFGSKKNKILSILVITAPAMFELGKLLIPLAFRIVRKIFENLFFKKVEAETIFDPNNIGVLHVEGETYTFADVLFDPVQAITLILRTIRYNLKTWFYGSFGRALSGNSLILPTTLVHLSLGMLVLAALREEEYVSSIWFKVAIIFMCVFGGLMMVGGMLISWTEIEQDIIEDFGGPVIQGVQGRYFSPFLPYLFLVLHNKKIQIPKKFDHYLIYASILLVFEVVVYVLSYTFIN